MNHILLSLCPTSTPMKSLMILEIDFFREIIIPVDEIAIDETVILIDLIDEIVILIDAAEEMIEETMAIADPHSKYLFHPRLPQNMYFRFL